MYAAAEIGHRMFNCSLSSASCLLPCHSVRANKHKILNSNLKVEPYDQVAMGKDDEQKNKESKPKVFVIDNQSPYFLHPSDSLEAIITTVNFN